MNSSDSPKQKSSVRHTRAIARDRSKHPNIDPPDEEVERLLTELLHPLTFAQVAHFQKLGLRERVLTLPVMVAFVLSLLWRQIGSVREGVRTLHQEGLLWTGPLLVSAQAMQQRLRTLPSLLWERILSDLLPMMQQRFQQRQRPLPTAVAHALKHFRAILAVDGSTLDALQKQIGLLRETTGKPLAGRMAALLDIASLLPRQVWYEENSAAHDQVFWQRTIVALEPNVLLLFDLGFVNYPFFDQLSTQNIGFITRLRSSAHVRVLKTLQEGPAVRDCLITLGQGDTRCETTLRMVALLYKGKWYRYLTNQIDPLVLPCVYVVALYWQRWRIEEAYLMVKRLLGLSYFLSGAINAVQTQLWATWILYAVLTDLCDAVAEGIKQPFAMISMEMVYRGLYHFSQAYQKAKADDPVQYLVVKARELAVIKAKRPKALDAVELLTNQLKA